jgi:hypothetical protein
MLAFLRISLVSCAALLLSAPLAHARSTVQKSAAAAARLGLYNCYSKGYPIVYEGSVQLRAGGRYGWIPRHGESKAEEPALGLVQGFRESNHMVGRPPRTALRRGEDVQQVRSLGEGRKVLQLLVLLQVLNARI